MPRIGERFTCEIDEFDWRMKQEEERAMLSHEEGREIERAQGEQKLSDLATRMTHQVRHGGASMDDARQAVIDHIARREDAAIMKEKLEDGRDPLKPARDWEPLTTIKDSGERMQFASGSMRDPSTGKIDWTKITHGPMMRRWAQHLTAAEKKYPDPRPGVPNFTLIETEEERIRYKVSAFRHFMSWFYDEMDEDHAAAVFFNINGVEIIRDKQRKKEAESAESFYGPHTIPGVTKV